MIKLLLQGEGPTDCGAIEYGTGNFLEGPIPIYIRKVLSDCTMELLPREMRNRFKYQRSVRGLQGHGVRAFLLAAETIERNADVAVLYVDADKAPAADATEEHLCKKRYAALKEEIMEGFRRPQKAIQCVAIIPMKMIESWMMGDPAAFEKAFGKPVGKEKKKGKEKQNKNIFPSKPELEWGAKDDSDGNYPKHRLQRILTLYQKEACREVFCEIANHSDIETLCKSCPISFRDFCGQLRALGTVHK